MPGGVHLTFQPGETEQTYMVEIHGDTDAESEEIVMVQLSNPRERVFAVFGIDDASGMIVTTTRAAGGSRCRQVVEGVSGSTVLEVPVTQDRPFRSTVTADL